MRNAVVEEGLRTGYLGMKLRVCELVCGVGASVWRGSLCVVCELVCGVGACVWCVS